MSANIYGAVNVAAAVSLLAGGMLVDATSARTVFATVGVLRMAGPAAATHALRRLRTSIRGNTAIGGHHCSATRVEHAFPVEFLTGTLAGETVIALNGRRAYLEDGTELRPS